MKNLLKCSSLIKVAVVIVVMAFLAGQVTDTVQAKGGTSSGSGFKHWNKHYQDNDECEYGKGFKRNKRNKWMKKCVCLQKEISAEPQEGNINISGTVKANKFEGDGSMLTGINGGGGGGLTVGGGQVFDSTGTIPVTWTTLDLSSVVGTNHAFVILRINDVSAGDNALLAFRQKGDTNDYDYNNVDSSTNMTILDFPSSESTQVIIYTDSNGQIEMKSIEPISGISFDVVLYIL